MVLLAGGVGRAARRGRRPATGATPSETATGSSLASPASASWAREHRVLAGHLARGLLGLDDALRLRGRAGVRRGAGGRCRATTTGCPSREPAASSRRSSPSSGRARDHVIASGRRQPARDPRLRRLVADRADRPGAGRPERRRLPGGGPARPGNADAKFNLELLLRQLVAQGSRQGPSSTRRGPDQGPPRRGRRTAREGILIAATARLPDPARGPARRSRAVVPLAALALADAARAPGAGRPPARRSPAGARP